MGKILRFPEFKPRPRVYAGIGFCHRLIDFCYLLALGVFIAQVATYIMVGTWFPETWGIMAGLIIAGSVGVTIDQLRVKGRPRPKHTETVPAAFFGAVRWVPVAAFSLLIALVSWQTFKAFSGGSWQKVLTTFGMPLSMGLFILGVVTYLGVKWWDRKR